MTRLDQPYPMHSGRSRTLMPAGDLPPRPQMATGRPARSRHTILWASIAVITLLVIAGLVAYFAYGSGWLAMQGADGPSDAGPRSMPKEIAVFSGNVTELKAAPGNTVRPQAPDAAIAWISSSLTSAKSSGSTDGVSIKLPESLSRDVASKQVRVTVSAGRGATQALSPFAVSYSTGAAGDSGWIVFSPSEEFTEHSFTYRVPRRSSGFTHYIGIWSDIEGQNTPLAVRSITITALP